MFYVQFLSVIHPFSNFNIVLSIKFLCFVTQEAKIFYLELNAYIKNCKNFLDYKNQNFSHKNIQTKTVYIKVKMEAKVS